jgi:tRNA U34 5-methylaminomethyl-2-thiouridine-forming methyltransferase MnmC
MGIEHPYTPEILITADGSQTLYLPQLDVTYHSRHGAMQESRHVFIDAALKPQTERLSSVRVLEMGFGTGLNALLALQHALQVGKAMVYHSIEAFPIGRAVVNSLHYPIHLQGLDTSAVLSTLHAQRSGEACKVHALFECTVFHTTLQAYDTGYKYDVVFFDAFAPNCQPELWTIEVFQKLAACMATGAILSTYCSKGVVRRAMAKAGLKVEKLPGPPGKREMVRAIKP